MSNGAIQWRWANSNREQNDLEEGIRDFPFGIIFKMAEICSRARGTPRFKKIEDLNRDRGCIFRAVVTHCTRIKGGKIAFLGLVIQANENSSIIL